MTVGGIKRRFIFIFQSVDVDLAGKGLAMPDKFKDKPLGVTEFVKSDYNDALILDSVHADNLMSAVMNLAAEVWVVRRRLLIAEDLAAKKIFATGAAIDAYKPTAQQTSAWEQERDVFIDRTLSVLTRPAHKIESAQIPMTRNAAPLLKL